MQDDLTPLSAPERVLELADGKITTLTAVSPDETCLRGHYPDLPILPGVMLVEMMQRAVRRYAVERLGRPARLRTLHTVRFFAPVSPGDEVTTECGVTPAGDTLEVTARCRAGQGSVASVRATYQLSSVPSEVGRRGTRSGI